jgi:hypothetical protein
VTPAASSRSGCRAAPELDDVVESGAAAVLLYVRRTDDGLEVLRTKA